ncbi:MAG TPA: FAD-dependent oxidoreductase [Alphaproteobacteria bacterium]
MKISIVGGGIMGLASAWALARDGHSVTVFEQGTLPNPLGSSVDEHRLIRHPYGAERGYTRMIGPAYAAWDQLWADLGATHYAPTGTLVLDRGDPWTADTAETLAAEGIPFKRVGPRGVIETYPMLAADHVRGGLVLDSGGSLFARRIVAHLARYLDGRGVDIGSEILVRRVDPERGRLWIADDIRGDQPVDADLLIVAAGPWATRLVPALQPRVTPSRQTVMYLTPPPDLAAAWMAHPMVLDLDLTSGFYVVPPRPLPGGGTSGLKIGNHAFTLTGDPDRDRAATGEETHRLLDLCARSLRQFERYAIKEAKICFYDVEPQERFIVEPLGARGWMLSGFSGHGFKFGALVGLELARAIRGDLAPQELSAWAAGRLPT